MSLEWTAHPETKTHYPRWEAGEYLILSRGNKRVWREMFTAWNGERSLGRFPSLDEAKAACQSDKEAK